MPRWHLVFGAIKNTRDLPKKDTVGEQSQPKTVEMWGSQSLWSACHTLCVLNTRHVTIEFNVSSVMLPFSLSQYSLVIFYFYYFESII